MLVPSCLWGHRRTGAGKGHARPCGHRDSPARPRGKGAEHLPLEHRAASCGRVNPEDTWRLYAALADLACVEVAVTVDSPEVLVDGLVHHDGRRFLWLVSQSDGPLMVRPRLPAGAQLVPFGGGDAVGQVELAPYGVAVLQLSTTEDEH